MRIFLACSNLIYRSALAKHNVKNILVAYPYAKENWFKHFDEYLKEVDNVNLLLDSGAFSVWTLGQTIKIEDYIKFVKVIQKRYEGRLNSLEVVNLDVIPGQYGTRPSLAEVESSAKAGRDNFQAMLKEGIRSIPVFHQHEDPKWLQFMKQETDYIGISPANDINTKDRMVWMDSVYHDLRGNYKTHSFGGISPQILKRYPLFSGDSSSWTAWARWGRGANFKMQSVSPRKRDSVLYFIGRDIEKYLHLEEFVTRLWASRGVKW